jgi:hypothetical protein
MKWLLLLSLVVACGKKSDYVYKVEEIRSQLVSERHQLSEEGKVDIIWVIDNSGSMAGIQQSVIQNANLFIQEFTRIQGLDWRMALLSTALHEAPYLGMPTVFDYKHRDPVSEFTSAVSRLGISGDATERSFDPILRQLNAHPNFLRPNAHIVMIYVTDEEEQSSITANGFLTNIVALKAGRLGMVRAYGAIEARDLGCSGYNVYGGSPYEAVISATKGSVIGTCSPQFGAELAKLGNEIVSIVSSPVVLLSQRPLARTIKVTYKGTELPPGPRSNGGFWRYDPDANGVRFHDYGFLDVGEQHISIDFEIDQGQQ